MYFELYTKVQPFMATLIFISYGNCSSKDEIKRSKILNSPLYMN